MRHKKPKLTLNVDLTNARFDRTFVIALRDGRQVIARVPYPRRPLATTPSPARWLPSTLEHLRSRRIPEPQIYGYSANVDNAAGIPYILIEMAQGSLLTEIWPDLGDKGLFPLSASSRSSKRR